MLWRSVEILFALLAIIFSLATMWLLAMALALML